MNTVEPFYTEEERIKCYDVAYEHDQHRKKGDTSWELLLTIGFGCGIRISDLAKLKVWEITEQEKIQIRAQKTGKETNIEVNREALLAARSLLKGRNRDEYIFPSRKRDPITHEQKPISRVCAYQIVNQIAQRAGIKRKVGCHSMRKTFGYIFYQESKDVATLQKTFGHSDPKVTLRYIGVEQRQQDEITRNMKTYYNPRNKRRIRAYD